MPYSDLSDAWNSYDPRYRRVTDSDQYTETIPAVDTGQIQGPTRPGYNDPTVLARVYNDLQRDLKLNPDQALGFLSNLNAESFGFTRPQEDKPLIKGSRGGLGWGQWTAGRRNSFEDYLNQTGMSPTSYEGNYGFLTSELQDPNWQPFLDNLRRQKGAESSTRYVERAYENPLRKTGRQDWLARTRRELPASESALAQGAQTAPTQQAAPSQGQPISNLKRIGYDGEGFLNIGDTRAAAPSAPDDSEPPEWIKYYRQLISKIPEIGAPPQDEYIPDPERNYFTNEDIKRGRLQDLGIYAAPRSPPAGDVVLPREDLPGTFNPNNRNATIWPGASRRMWDDLQIQNKLGTLTDDFKKFFYRSEQDQLLHGFGQQIEGDFPPSYLRNISNRGFLGLR